MIQIKKGLDLPIAGKPAQVIEGARAIRTVAVLGEDFPGLRPTMAVREGETVSRGGLLFTDKKNPGVNFTSPVAGTVIAINRGAKRALLSVVIDVHGDASEDFGARSISDIADLDRPAIVDTLTRSGLWTAFRTRPYSKVPAVDNKPNSIFVTAVDTNPLAADPRVVIGEASDAFALGVSLVSKLTDGRVYVCQSAGPELVTASSQISNQQFGGAHPAGLPGTHIHFLDPVGIKKSVWYIGYQDIIAMGKLFTSGKLSHETVIAIGGPGAEKPRLVKTVLGANLDELTAGETTSREVRVISGSVLAGHHAEGPRAYLGRYHQQVSLLPEDTERRLFGYLTPGTDRHSVFPIYLSKWFGEKNIKFSTSSNGSPRAMVPIGTYDSVMPMDILATQLLRSLLVGDVESAINLGCLELDEEDVALCTYACPGKYEYGPVLRQMLTQIEKEG